MKLLLKILLVFAGLVAALAGLSLLSRSSGSGYLPVYDTDEDQPF